MFVAVYGTETHSNNNAWLRRKLLDAVGASRRLCNRTSSRPRRRPAAGAAAARQRAAAAAATIAAAAVTGSSGVGSAPTADAGSSVPSPRLSPSHAPHGPPWDLGAAAAPPFELCLQRPLDTTAAGTSSGSASCASLSWPPAPAAAAAAAPLPLLLRAPLHPRLPPPPSFVFLDGCLVNTHSMEAAL